MKLYVMSRESAERALRGPHPYTHLISIDDTRPEGAVMGGEPVPGFESVPERLFLEFDDISHNSHPWSTLGYRPPDESIAQQVIDFAAKVPSQPGTHLLVHCAAGISRSTASAFIVRAIQRGAGHEVEALYDVVAVRPSAHPNKLMVELADDLLKRGGKMTDALAGLERARRTGLL